MESFVFYKSQIFFTLVSQQTLVRFSKISGIEIPVIEKDLINTFDRSISKSNSSLIGREIKDEVDTWSVLIDLKADSESDTAYIYNFLIANGCDKIHHLIDWHNKLDKQSIQKPHNYTYKVSETYNKEEVKERLQQFDHLLKKETIDPTIISWDTGEYFSSTIINYLAEKKIENIESHDNNSKISWAYKVEYLTTPQDFQVIYPANKGVQDIIEHQLKKNLSDNNDLSENNSSESVKTNYPIDTIDQTNQVSEVATDESQENEASLPSTPIDDTKSKSKRSRIVKYGYIKILGLSVLALSLGYILKLTTGFSLPQLITSMLTDPDRVTLNSLNNIDRDISKKINTYTIRRAIIKTLDRSGERQLNFDKKTQQKQQWIESIRNYQKINLTDELEATGSFETGSETDKLIRCEVKKRVKLDLDNSCNEYKLYLDEVESTWQTTAEAIDLLRDEFVKAHIAKKLQSTEVETAIIIVLKLSKTTSYQNKDREESIWIEAIKQMQLQYLKSNKPNGVIIHATTSSTSSTSEQQYAQDTYDILKCSVAKYLVKEKSIEKLNTEPSICRTAFKNANPK
jgi:hypothetical protein